MATQVTRNTQQSVTDSTAKSLRLWPGLLIVGLLYIARFVLPMIDPDMTQFGMMAAPIGMLAVIIWWAFFSRATRLERWVGVILMVASLALTPYILHESITTGMMGMMFMLYATPVISLAVVAWAVFRDNIPENLRLLSLAAAILIAGGAWGLVRTGGFTGDIDHDFAWRWSATPEELLLANAEAATTAQPLAGDSIEVIAVQWPGFRGPKRDGVIRGITINSDWANVPPVELWRRAIGPGWGSFSVQGDRFYTQEQRGEEELVACYSLSSGEPLWWHSDSARFWESNGGAGPRSTPTIHGDRLYTIGATGILNALNIADGSKIWSRNISDDTKVNVPGWGFASSPLIVDSMVVIAASGRLAAYDIESGEPRWMGEKGGYGYSSPHLATIDGVRQILLMRGNKASGFAPADGKLLWDHPMPSGGSMVQPGLIEGGDLLVSDGERTGIRRLAISRASGSWNVEERWTSIGLKPYFNGFVIHNGHAYGFDGSILSCIDLNDGQRKWKGGRYGYGQMVLLADQDLLLVLSEKGGLALVKATPEKFEEVAFVPAINGKTWNHPVLVDGILLVRNAEEMAAFRLSGIGS